MVLLSLFEARDIMGPKAIIASVVVVLAILQFATMSIIYGWLPGSEALRQRLRPYHLWEGRLVLIFVAIVASLCLITWGPRATSLRVLLHSILGITVVLTLISKVVVIRFVPSFSKFIPVLGSILFVSFIAIWFLTAYWYWFTDGTGYTGSLAPSAVVKITDIEGAPGRFFQADVTIKAGEVVEWDQESSRAHTVTGDGFDSGPDGLSSGENFKFQFTKPGKYSYFCNFHPTVMKGTVTVTGASTSPSVSPSPKKGY